MESKLKREVHAQLFSFFSFLLIMKQNDLIRELEKPSRTTEAIVNWGWSLIIELCHPVSYSLLYKEKKKSHLLQLIGFPITQHCRFVVDKNLCILQKLLYSLFRIKSKTTNTNHTYTCTCNLTQTFSFLVS